VRGLGPFDCILANPPFVAVHAPAPGLGECAEWAMYADGGPDGATVLRKIMAADDDRLLRPGGCLSMVSEYPNIRSAHAWLPSLGGRAGEGPDRRGWALAVVYEPRAHVQEARDYAEDRSSERGWPWGDRAEWEASLRAHGVEHMGSGLVFAVRRAGDGFGADCALDGPAREADLSLVESSGPIVERIRDSLLAGADRAALEAMAREHVHDGRPA
jgi:hypothetical protein